MSRSTAYRYILELEKRGLVSYSGKNTLETELQRKMRCGFKRIPIIGQIVCGSPEEQEEHVSGYLAIPEEWIDGECFLLRAYGDSMIDIGKTVAPDFTRKINDINPRIGTYILKH